MPANAPPGGRIIQWPPRWAQCRSRWRPTALAPGTGFHRVWAGSRRRVRRGTRSLIAEQPQHMLDIEDGWFPDDVSGDTEDAGLGLHLRSHFFVGTYEHEWRIRDVIGRSAGSIAADLLDRSLA